MVVSPMVRRTLVLAFIALASVARADDFARPRFLLPVYTPGQDVDGINGVRWRVELTAANESDTDVILGPCAAGYPPPPGDAPCPPTVLRIPANRVLVNPTVGWTAAGVYGRLVYFDPAQVASVHFALTLFRNGTPVASVPVVDLGATLPSGTTHLLGLHLEPGARALLRTYDVFNRPRIATVRAYRVPGMFTDAPEKTWSIILQPSPYVDPGGTPYAPSYAELAIGRDDIGASDFRLEITPSDNIGGLWSFASITGADAPSVVIVSQQ
jgi:hypothetical protein